MKKRNLLALTAALALSSSAAFAASSAQDAAAEAASAAPVAVKSAPTQPNAQRTAASKDGKTKETAVTPSYIEAPEEFEIASLGRPSTVQNYRLFKGDTMRILPIGFTEDIKVEEIPVGVDGCVQLPYVGSVKLEGMTLDEAKKTLLEAFGEYMRIPDISVFVTKYGKRKVYVMGDVTKPGIQEMDADNMNAYAALASAGSWTDRGRSTRIQVIRVRDNVMYYRMLNMKAYVKKHDITQNVFLEDGDIVYVPATNGIRFQEDILPYINVWALYKSLTD